MRIGVRVQMYLRMRFCVSYIVCFVDVVHRLTAGVCSLVVLVADVLSSVHICFWSLFLVPSSGLFRFSLSFVYCICFQEGMGATAMRRPLSYFKLYLGRLWGQWLFSRS